MDSEQPAFITKQDLDRTVEALTAATVASVATVWVAMDAILRRAGLQPGDLTEHVRAARAELFAPVSEAVRLKFDVAFWASISSSAGEAGPPPRNT